MELFDVISDYLCDESFMDPLLTIDGKAFVSYLMYIFDRLNVLNNYLQGHTTTIILVSSVYLDTAMRDSSMED